MYKFDKEEIHAIKLDMQEHTDSSHKESEICVVYPEQSTAKFQ